MPRQFEVSKAGQYLLSSVHTINQRLFNFKDSKAIKKKKKFESGTADGNSGKNLGYCACL
jgi:hypothetical protein